MTDLNDRTNVAGIGINVAQRVMDCGDAGHILLSKRVAEDLEQYEHWQPHLHDLGEVEVKHDVRVHIFNLFTDDLGNPALPEKLRLARAKEQQAERAATANANDEGQEHHQRFLIKFIVAQLSMFATASTQVSGQPRRTVTTRKREPIQVLVGMSDAFKSEDEVVAICAHLRENTKWTDPFAVFESKYGPNSLDGKRLKFLKDASISGHAITNEEDALNYISAVWAGRNNVA